MEQIIEEYGVGIVLFIIGIAVVGALGSMLQYL